MGEEKKVPGFPFRGHPGSPLGGHPGFLKTSPDALELSRERPVLEGNRVVFPESKQHNESKFQRVAKFLILIGSDRAAEILSRLPPDQVEVISKEIASVRAVGYEEGRVILEEFSSLLASPYQLSGPSSGGVEAARRVLYAAFGPDKGERLLVKAVPEVKPNLFGFLEDFSGEQLALLFKEEQPSAAAIVFSRLPPKLAAAALARITGEKKLEIVRRIAKQAPVAPEVLEQVALALREKARHIGKQEDVHFNGMEALAAILKSSDTGFGDEILSQLELEDPELGKTLKEQVYTISDLLEASDLPIQKKLASMDDRDIILLLKARAGNEDTMAFRQKILGNLSQGRREAILEEEAIVGAVPRRDVELAAGAFLAWFRQSRDEGSIVMKNDDLIF
ncbi:flagellar motor switch protein FliG [Spirochaetia bacterium]|nr:flagellar motor switch protein FliG [Spirochaetia bacterium]